METDLAAEIALQQFIWFSPSADTGSLLEAPINFLRTDTQEKLLFSIVNGRRHDTTVIENNRNGDNN